MIKIFRHFFADFSHFADISTPICLGRMIDEAGSRRQRGRRRAGNGRLGVEQWEFLKKCAQKSPMTGKSNHGGNLMYSSEEQTDAILPSFGRL